MPPPRRFHSFSHRAHAQCRKLHTMTTIDLLTRFAPWVPTLQRNATLPSTSSMDSSPSGVFWIEDHAWHCCIGRARRTHIEAVELLGLLARVDWQLWQQVVKTIWPAQALQWEGTFATSSFKVGIEFTIMPSTGMERLSEAIITVPAIFPASCGYNELKMSMATLLRERGASEAMVPIRLVMRYMQSEEMTLELFKILQHEVTIQHFAPDQASKVYRHLRVRELKFPSCWLCIDATLCRYVLEIVTRGIHVSHLPTITPEVYNMNRGIFRRALWTCLDVGEDQSNNTSIVPASAVSITWMPQDPVQVSATYLALRSSRSVRKISIQASCREPQLVSDAKSRRVTWQWIAYSIFSGKQGEEQSREHLEVNVKELRSADVKSMRKLLQSRNPLAVLLTLTRVLMNTRNPVDTITASHFLLSDPAAGASVEPRFVSGRRLSGVPVVKETGKWLEVLLPAWGRAWVRLSDIEVYATGVHGGHTVYSIHTLTLTQMCASSVMPVREWLRDIGQGVRRLVIKELQSPGLMDDWFRELFVVCPNLEELEISGCHLKSLQLFVDSYASGACRLKRLILGYTSIDEVNTSLAGLLVALIDKHHVASIYLREFTCQGLCSESPVDQRLFVLIKQMLQSNNRLLAFEVTFRMPRSTSESLEGIVNALALGNKRTVLVATPLEITRKAASLSAVFGFRDDVQVHPIHELDAVALMTVFQFAGSWPARSMLVRLIRT